MTAPSTEALVRLWFAIGGLVTGVASTIAGSWISSKIHVYHENRKVHLDEIKQKVLVPLKEILIGKYAALVKHKTFAVLEHWGTRKRLEGVSVIQNQTEEGPSLVGVFPYMWAGVDSALHADAKKKHFSRIMQQLEAFDERSRAHANKCHAWVVHLSDEILARSGLASVPSVAYGESFVNPYKLGLYIYRRLFRVWEQSLTKHSPNYPPVNFVLEGFEGTSATGSKKELAGLVTVLDELMIAERTNADELQAEAHKLDKHLAALMAEIDYAIAYRRLRKRCNLVPFF